MRCDSGSQVIGGAYDVVFVVECSANCKTCSDGSTCSACKDGFVLDANVCAAGECVAQANSSRQ